MYRVSAEINNVEVLSENLDIDFQIDFNNLQPKLDNPNLKIIFICSPNNPTGNKIEKEVIRNIAKNFDGIVVVDEAYIDFSGDSLVGHDIPNLCILQTFSKAKGLAGIRLGVGIGNPAIIEVLDKLKPPYNVSTPTQKAAFGNAW